MMERCGTRLMRIALVAVVLVAIEPFPETPAIAATITSGCVLAKSGNTFSGFCHFSGEAAHFTVSKRLVPEGGMWRAHVAPEAIWGGDMRYDHHEKTFPVQIQFYSGGSGVLQTVDGWFPVQSYSLTSASLSFDVVGQREVAPNELDRQIIERALRILSSPAVWNRNDNRKCPVAAATYSLYCAGERAIQNVANVINHRRPAMEVIRAVVDDRVKNRNYQHRLMDYNNDPTTTFNDIQSVLRQSLAIMSNQAWLREHGFATNDNMPRRQ